MKILIINLSTGEKKEQALPRSINGRPVSLQPPGD